MIKLGQCEFDLATREFRRNGEMVPLGTRAFDILALLVSASGRLVTKDELMSSVWPDTIVEENNIQVQLSALRKALGDDRNSIKTVPGRGYQLIQRPVESGQTAQPAHPATAVQSVVTESRPRNLPLRRSHLIGREDAIAEVRTALSRTHILTLVGAGGIGKTTLAIAVGHAIADESSDPVNLVELAALTDRDAILCAIADSCGLGTDESLLTIDTLRVELSRSDRVMLLDNAEHVIDDVAVIVEGLTAGNDHLRVLVTSRERLRIASESVFRVEPLDVPAIQATEHEILGHSAVRLFVTRAQAMQATTDVATTHLALIGEICRRLDGIPLAIELAAARVLSFGVEGVCQRLDDRMTILTGGYRTALPRHQTLRATFDWSYRLLEPASRMLFRRLGLFGGVFTLETMCAVACDTDLKTGAAIDAIGDLVSKSMVNVEFDGPVAQYRLTESTRAYALEQLQAEGETQVLAARHARHIASHFGRAGQCTPSARETGSLDIRQTLDDARHAFDWALSDHGEPRLAVELASKMVGVLMELGQIGEAAQRAELALSVLDSRPDLPVDATSRMRIMAALASTLPNLSGPMSRSVELWLNVMHLADTSGDAEFEVRAYWGLWNTAFYGARIHEALEYARRLRWIAQARDASWEQTLADLMIAISHHCLGRHDEARSSIEAALRHLAEHPEEVEEIRRLAVDARVFGYGTLARIVWLQGHPELALDYVDQAVNLLVPGTMEPSLTHVLGSVAVPLALLSGDLRRSHHYLEIMRSQTVLHDFTTWREYAECLSGHRDIVEGRIESGLRIVETSLDSLLSRGFRRLVTPMIVILAEALVAAGRYADASVRLREAADHCDRFGEAFFLPEVWRVQGLAAQAKAMREQRNSSEWRLGMSNARSLLERAIELSRAQGALMWELRATTAMARLLQELGNTGQAITLLDVMTARFDRDSRAPDVQEMFALTDTLRGITTEVRTHDADAGRVTTRVRRPAAAHGAIQGTAHGTDPADDRLQPPPSSSLING